MSESNQLSCTGRRLFCTNLQKQFHTTVTELILLNSGVNPYNLQTGMRLTICPGEGYVDENESKPSEGNTNKPTKTPVGGIVIIPGTTTQPGGTTRRELRHSRELQHAREPQRAGKQHGRGSATAHAHGMAQSYYTCKILSHQFFENLSSQNAWKDAVYKNAEEILAIFAQYYPASAMQRFRKLFMEHLRLTDEVAAGLKADPAFSGATMENWYINAEEIASFFEQTDTGLQRDRVEKNVLRSS